MTSDANSTLPGKPLTSDEIVRVHYKYVWRSLVRLGARSRDVEDLTQEVFLVAHHRLASFDQSRPIKPWLFGIAFNTLRSARRLARNAREQASDTLDLQASDSKLGAMEASDLVHRALSLLDEDLRVTFILYELDDVSVADIAATFNVATDTVYARLRKAREEFRTAVEKLQKGEAK